MADFGVVVPAPAGRFDAIERPYSVEDVLRLRGHYLAMATVGVGEIVRLVLNNWEAVTGGAQGVKNIPPARFGPLVHILGPLLRSSPRWPALAALMNVPG